LKRLRVAAFAALVVATVAAFFVTQHLKVSNPLINGARGPDPAVFNPVAGRVCVDAVGQRVSFRRTRVSFYLQSRSDSVIVSVINSAGSLVATLASGKQMRVDKRGVFTWNGRQGAHSNGAYAPDGTYYLQVALLHAGRTFQLPRSITILTSSPRPVVTDVRVQASAATTPGPASAATGTTTGPVIIAPPGQAVAIHFKHGDYSSALIQIYRTDLPGKPRVVKSFRVNQGGDSAVWNGLIAGLPAPAGTYLVGIAVTDPACNLGVFPPVNPPPPGSTSHTGVTVRYLAVQPPLTPVPAGAFAVVLVDSAGRPYTWALRRAGSPKLLRRGAAGPRAVADGAVGALRVPLPAGAAGLYELAIRAGTSRTAVPVIASATGHRAAVHVLVVLPALTWQGRNPVDDTGDGLPDTLTEGQIYLQRPLVDGLPSGLAQAASLLRYLDSKHMAYQLTSDVALAESVGPGLGGHRGVILDGDFVWTPPALQALLQAYAKRGGDVVADGISSLLQAAPLTAGASATIAGPPSAPTTRDVFGAQPGPVVANSGELITTLRDPLGIFAATSGAFSGFATYETIEPPAAASASMAGVGDSAPSIIGFHYGAGKVVEIGLPGFASTLAGNVDSQGLIDALWQLLSGGH
jgi:hypothetical protein